MSKKKGYGEFIDGCLPLELLMDYWIMPFLLIVAMITIPCWLPLYILGYFFVKLSTPSSK